jgi:hypothetical protein
MDHTTLLHYPAPARYPVVGSSGNVVDIQTLPRHSIEAWTQCAVITFSQHVRTLVICLPVIASGERRASSIVATFSALFTR